VVQDGVDFINPSHLMQEARARGAGGGQRFNVKSTYGKL
jgi:hypothetical protein